MSEISTGEELVCETLVSTSLWIQRLTTRSIAVPAGSSREEAVC